MFSMGERGEESADQDSSKTPSMAMSTEATTMVTMQTVHTAPHVVELYMQISVTIKRSSLPDSRSFMLLYDTTRPTDIFMDVSGWRVLGSCTAEHIIPPICMSHLNLLIPYSNENP
ncbi:hypothetical protein TNCV_2458891 [Trichonephila clavipes]|nr:hypothetical protein TNCV_2458891 [Trichonephila clavipes]